MIFDVLFITHLVRYNVIKSNEHIPMKGVINMYTAVKTYGYQREISTGNATQEAIARARKIAKKRKSELEMKIILLLLLSGNAVAFAKCDFIQWNFFGFFLCGLLAVVTAIAMVWNFVKLFLTVR